MKGLPQKRILRQPGFIYLVILMPLPPYPDGTVFLRLVIACEKKVVAYQFILQPGSFVCNVLFKFFHNLKPPNNL